MDDLGIGVVAGILIAIVVIGSVPASCVVVDTIDVNPDHPLYRMERVGEDIKKWFVTPRDWEHEHAEERMFEFRAMCAKGKCVEYKNLLEEYGRHIEKLEETDIEEVYNLVMAMIEKHNEVLENLLEVVPPQAVPAIQLALSRKGRLKDVLKERFPAMYENYRKHLPEIRREYENWLTERPWARRKDRLGRSHGQIR